MRLWSAHSISGRLTALVLLVSGTALLLAYISFLGYDFYSLRQNLIESLQTQASMIGANSEAALLFDDQQAAETTLSALRGSPTIVSAEIFRADGRPFAGYTRPDFSKRSIAPKLELGQTSAFWTQERTVLVGQVITSEGKPIGAVYIEAETRDVAHRAIRFGWISASILLLCFAISALATSAMRGLIIRPLESLAATAHAVSRQKDYSIRAEVPQRQDELAFLVKSFNEMLEEVDKGRTVLEQKVAERTADLSAANRELEAFSYTVAHDLRGPLQQITNIAYLLQYTASESASPEESSLVNDLLAASARMSSLIEDLLSLSRATSTPLDHVPVDMSAIARSILMTLQQTGERHVEIVVADDCVAHADEGLITIVLENLLRNAWKYSSRKNPAHIEFGCRTEGDETLFFVKDDGAGFASADADRLFRPFQRLHSQAEFPGTGVGLATVHRIIERHGGRVSAVGVVNQGAEFCFTLPQHKHGI